LKFKEWMKMNGAKLEKSIKKQAKSKAMASDQARTPKWLMYKIKKFAHLTDEEIEDIFVY
jgi:hypothetical protein